MEAGFASEALKHKADAEKKMKGGGFFSKMFGDKEARLEEARDLFEKAANAFKMADRLKEAGECYEKCVEIEEKLDGMPANFMKEALDCYKKGDNERYRAMMDDAVMKFCQDGRISQAARMKKDQGEQFEESHDLPEAAQAFFDAGKLFERDN